MNGYWSTKNARAFHVMCLGQLVSAVGTGLTNFSLGVWVYEQTGSATKFALVTLFGFLPGGIALPFAGILIDRWSQRWSMILSNAGAGLTTLVGALLLFTARLELWHIYLGVGIRAVFLALLEPAFAASTTLLVRKQDFGRANGLVQTTRATAQILSPLLGGLLLSQIRLGGVLLVDFISYLFATSTLLMVTIPKPERIGSAITAAKRSFLGEAVYGWTYIKERPGLLMLLGYFAVINLVTYFSSALLTPMVLSFTTAKVLGLILGAGGAGFLCGSILMASWGGPKNRMHGILGFGCVFGFCCMLAGLRPSPLLIGIAVFGMFLVLPIINGCSQAIWQCKTPVEVQGRVFAIRRVIVMSTIPISLVLAGPLADKVFEPLVARNDSLSFIIGQGAGRGIGLMMLIAGAFAILTQFVAYLSPRLRLVEAELADAVPDITLVQDFQDSIPATE